MLANEVNRIIRMAIDEGCRNLRVPSYKTGWCWLVPSSRHRYNDAAAMTTNPDGTPDDLTKAEQKLSEMLRIPLLAPLSEECDNEFLLRFRTE